MVMMTMMVDGVVMMMTTILMSILALSQETAWPLGLTGRGPGSPPKSLESLLQWAERTFGPEEEL
jgi:hypothetical protein